ncbi:hypothetical protein [Motiliproteus sp. MSK22-1]|uniref:hypothetical protein n=1 Tax=Motiliproteus sp. MSK22-1 TaxID=1897630 RepID=UPI0018E988E7|nr:hypothetical protein [Motiliproteus sp. MSK22-1]
MYRSLKQVAAVFCTLAALLMFSNLSYASSHTDPNYTGMTLAAANPCAANPCATKNPCAANPCAAKNPCAANPCAAKNPCAIKKKKMNNPCAANPCAAKNPCAVKNPCAS